MYLAHSALRARAEENHIDPSSQTELQLRCQAYQTACSKYSHYIAEIQKYFPGWQPAPPES